ncbi:S-layer homology domain-containing protein [Candidatus Formimonas warabiya]|uniref:DUF4430 domain-containing protein n=1 Tax=Formimonas warabiya TaxID=1761012 RepID=A0A3G1KYP1_FORW1|nr:S-layer homology domain-containing protein [Candidatus Formimonas warabiya]ATW27572.1 hypothetical protein DCMF_24970 [Candidatus Formimonas warabiya]
MGFYASAAGDARLQSIEFASASASGVPYELRPELDENAFEYNVIVPDTLSNFYVKPVLSDEAVAAGQTIKVTTPTGVSGTQMSFATNNAWKSLSLSLGQGATSKTFWIHVGNGVTGSPTGENYYGTVDTRYTFNVIRKLSLSGLTVNDTLSPTFNNDTLSYTAYIPVNDDTVSITVTTPVTGYNLTIGGKDAASSVASELTLDWDINGQMTVPIVVSNNGSGAISTTYTLTLIKETPSDVPQFSLQPKDATYFDTATATPLAIKAFSNGEMTYQWYSNGNNSNTGGTPIGGATSANFTPPITNAGTQTFTTYYYCVVSNSIGNSAASNPAAITIRPDPTPYNLSITLENGDPYPAEGYMFPIGTNAESLPKLKINAQTRYDGNDGAFAYQWWRRTAGSTGSSGCGTTEVITPAVTTDGEYYYYCTVTYNIGSKKFPANGVKSDEVGPFKVYATSAPAPTISKQAAPDLGTHLVGTNNLYFLQITASNVKSYQWYKSTDNENFEPVNGATDYKYTPGKTEAGTFYYFCRVTNTISSVTGETYSSYTDSDVSQVAFVTLAHVTGSTGWSGNGTESSPYLLEDVDDLAALRTLVHAGYTFYDAHFKLADNVTLPADWVPIGIYRNDGVTNGFSSKTPTAQEPLNNGTAYENKPFSGTFDGDGNTVTVSENGLPLFGFVREATVKNINLYGTKIAGYGLINAYAIDYGRDGSAYTEDDLAFTAEIENITIKAGTQTLKAGLIGGSASGIDYVYIKSCVAESGVTIGYDKAQRAIGSFAGSINGTLENCVSYADVYGTTVVGGLAGGKNQSMGPMMVWDSAFHGTVTATGNYVGGIIGMGYSSASAPNSPCVSVQNCYVTGDVAGSNYVGGIFGGEPAIYQNWANGIGYITNNVFYGTVRATEENAYVGGIVGYMKSLDRYNYIANNYYLDSCGAEQGIGGVDSNYVYVSVDGVYSFATLPSNDPGRDPDMRYKRDDDPFGADAGKLVKSVSETQLKGATIINALNNGPNSRCDWEQGADGPVFGSGKHPVSLSISGYKAASTGYPGGESLNLGEMSALVTYSDGTKETVPISDVTFLGFNSDVKGYITVTAKYGKLIELFETRITSDNSNPGSGGEGDEITVTLKVYGDTVHDDETVHTLKDGNLVEWLPQTEYTLTKPATVLDLLDAAEVNYHQKYWNYIDSVTWNGITLAEFTNGPNSGWMYTLNGVHPDLGVCEQFLEDGDSIVLHYTDDYTVETDAGNEPEPEPINVNISVQKDEYGFAISRREFAVRPGLAEEYGYDNHASVGANEVTALDALVAAHIAAFGEDRAAVNNALAVNNGFVTKVMGEDTSAFTFFVNGGMPNDGVLVNYPGYGEQYTGYSVAQAKLNENDTVEFFLIQDTDYYTDTYAWFESGGQKAQALTVTQGESFNLTVKGYIGMFYGLSDPATLAAHTGPIENAAVVSVNINENGAGLFNGPLAVTDEDGVAVLTFDEPGTYVISAVDNSNPAPLLSPWCVVTVVASGQDSAVTAVIEMINDLPDVVQLGDKNEVQAVREAYEDLTEEQQELVPQDTLNKLIAAEERIEQLESGSGGPAVNEILNGVLAYIHEQVESPGVGSTSGEWAVLALARAGIEDDAWYDTYRDNLKQSVTEEVYSLDPDTGKVVMHRNKYTENERVILALAALGEDAEDFDGYDFVSALTDRQASPNEDKYQAVWQGMNGAIYALIALDTNNYLSDMPEGRAYFLNYLTVHEKTNGGWSLNGSTDGSADPDITGMALQALAPYYKMSETKYSTLRDAGAPTLSAIAASVEKAVESLADLQDGSGGFTSSTSSEASSESAAQVLTALASLGSDGTEDGSFMESVLENLLTYRDTATGGFKHVSSAGVNQMATEQAAYALVAYARYVDGANTLYDMSSAFDWSLSDAPPAVDKTALNAEIERANELDESDYTAESWAAFQTALAAAESAADSSTATQTEVDNAKAALTAAIDALVEAEGGGSDQTITVKFRLIGATRSDGDIDLSDGDYKGSEYVTWIKTKSYTLDKGSMVYDLFTEALDDAELRSVGAEDNYVETIYAPSALGGYKLSEFTNGTRSGWMYTVNGRHVRLGLKEQTLHDGDKVIWHYVNDYSYEVADWFDDDPDYPPLGDGEYYNEWLKAPDVAPTANSGTSSGGGTSTPSSDSSTLAPKVTASNGVASASVSASNMTSAIADAKDKDSKAIVIAPEITGTAKKVSVDIPKASISSVASETDADLKIETPVGNITIPNNLLSSIASQAAGGSVTVSLESVNTATALSATQKEAVGGNPVYDISVVSGGNHISDFNGGSVTISLPYTLKADENPAGVMVWYLNDAGELEQITCTYNKTTGMATFTTPHLSYYVVGYSEAWQNPFTDVKATNWFYGAVEFAVKNGLFNGTTATVFSPNTPMTRTMLVTALYRLEGSPAITGTSGFNDVKDGEWYANAVVWASANGIVTGLGDGLFGVSDNVTREQLATILYNYAKYKGCDVTKAADLKAFTDASGISSWAETATKWANAEGLVTGVTTKTLVPGGSATRAQVATILMRIAESIVK